MISLSSHGGSGNVRATSITTDSMGGIILGGIFTGNANFFGDVLHSYSSEGLEDGFLARYDYFKVDPVQQFDATVSSSSNQNKYFLNGKEAPKIELFRGLTYEFILDGNSTLDHPFYISTESDGGANFSHQYSDGVSNSGATSGSLFLTTTLDSPMELFYNCGLHSGMGGKIYIPSDERPRSTLTFAAVDSGSNFITGGDWNVSSGNNFPVRSGQSILIDEVVQLTYTPPSGYVLSEWAGDLPDDANPLNSALSVDMTSDRAIQAVLSQLAPEPLELANSFNLEFTIQPTDETGNPVESNDPAVVYISTFELDLNTSSSAGRGTYSVSKVNGPDLNDDGNQDELRGSFLYQTDSAENISMTIENFQAKFEEQGEWNDTKGGGLSINLSMSAVNGSVHSGDYFILFNDGTNEAGRWTSDDIRSEPLTMTNNP